MSHQVIGEWRQEAKGTSILQPKCWNRALQSETRDQIFMQRILIVWNYLTKRLVWGETNTRVIQILEIFF